MRILVQKFGGTSLSTPQARERVVKHMQRERDNGYAVVIVVSAMGRRHDPYATDTLLSLIDEYIEAVSLRERDLLLGCGEIISAAVVGALISSKDIPVEVLTGLQAGIITDEQYGSAKIIAIHPERIVNSLKQNKIVVVTGFQGATTSGELTTLGRGGSDTSALAIGAALGAEMVDIYTDVDGVLTADPRFVEEAKPMANISYQEVCNMARQGAKVIHPRAVEIAQQARLPFRIRSTFSDSVGTLVSDMVWGHNEHAILDRHVTAIANVSGITQISVAAKAYEKRTDFLSVFQTLADRQISVDFINVTPTSALFTVMSVDGEAARKLLEEKQLEVQLRENCAKISVIGGGMNGQPGVMAKIVEALAKEDITILQTADSNASIWVLVQEQNMVTALKALHSMFDLNR